MNIPGTIKNVSIIKTYFQNIVVPEIAFVGFDGKMVQPEKPRCETRKQYAMISSRKFNLI